MISNIYASIYIKKLGTDPLLSMFSVILLSLIND